MFRRYFINDKDLIRQIAAPEKRFHYFISKNERYVAMHKEAMNGNIPLALYQHQH